MDPHPARYEPSEEEMAQYTELNAQMAQVHVQDQPPQEEQPLTSAMSDQALMDALDMDDYDKEEQTGWTGGHAMFASNADDPYLNAGDDEDSEDDEDNVIRPTDDVLLVGETDEGEEQSVLKVMVFDSEKEALFTHHDLALPAFPLATTWMNLDPRADSAQAAEGSFVAVGTFQPSIEIWPLDVTDVFEPVGELGGRDEHDPVMLAKLRRKLKKKKNDPKLQQQLLGVLREGSHEDAVMSLAWHRAQRQRLCSGSADCTLKLWDVLAQKCVTTVRPFGDQKLPCLSEHPVEGEVLLVGAEDASAAVLDLRQPQQAGRIVASLGSDLESLAWNARTGFHFALSLEDGRVAVYDFRRTDAPVRQWQAHEDSAGAVAFAPFATDCVVTAGHDAEVRVWDTKTEEVTQVAAKRFADAGALFSLQFQGTETQWIAAGGAKGLRLWDVSLDDAVRRRWA